MTSNPTKTTFTVAIAFQLLAVPAVSAERLWTDSTGKFQVVAELVAVRGNKVVLDRENGEQIIVPLSKLSVQDRQFLKKSEGDYSTTAHELSAAEIPGIARTFFADLRSTDRKIARQLLTKTSLSRMQGKQTPLAQLPTPDATKNSIRVGKEKVDGKVAEIPIYVRADGDLHKTKLHFRYEANKWCVFAISATYPDGETSINFEANGTTRQNSDPLRSLIGNSLALSGYTPDGRPLDMEPYRDKVVLVDFWATWCGPCRAEIPNMLQNWNQYHDAGFEIIAISVDQDLNVLQNFVDQEQPPWTVVADNHPQNQHSMGAKYGIRGIPAFILVGKDGKVAAVNCRGPELGRQLDRLLGHGAGVDSPIGAVNIRRKPSP